MIGYFPLLAARDQCFGQMLINFQTFVLKISHCPLNGQRLHFVCRASRFAKALLFRYTKECHLVLEIDTAFSDTSIGDLAPCMLSDFEPSLCIYWGFSIHCCGSRLMCGFTEERCTWW
jgi:hypothetical protein